MNAITAINLDVTPWNEATRCVNEWRGHALHCFAEAELAVSETLLAMQTAPQGGKPVRLRRLIGQRFEDLRIAVAPDGPFAAEGENARAALAAFATHEPLRIFLCHGLAKVALDRNGNWVVILKILSFRAREAERSDKSYDHKEAEQALSALKAATRKLVSSLQSLRMQVGRTEA